MKLEDTSNEEKLGTCIEEVAIYRTIFNIAVAYRLFMCKL